MAGGLEARSGSSFDFRFGRCRTPYAFLLISLLISPCLVIQYRKHTSAARIFLHQTGPPMVRTGSLSAVLCISGDVRVCHLMPKPEGGF
ncbi:hypothetical protein JMJ77_0008754 [Colletotrichum scovillei]|uniref:Uncharacterized protein n=1 Tax=Colletotrichum scovillei TaxID=1209932 RepID=A0A9P7U818_9PEZI|nr:hypothetical protein JMJ78_0001608 [Colletotrichum scovillei]KAG7041049.1 hypothetical protein JMJ77_0008754 [Colletotrichum scovillei]KAG7061082.1 hypothetical protein JMJ76_0010152 [Colletotrichum scovillei]